MFNYIKIKNFLTIGDVVFDFRKTKSETNQFAVIYGENGSGKTSFIQSFNLLFNSIHSFAYQQNYEHLSSAFHDQSTFIKDILQNMALFSNFTDYLSSLRMIDCNEPTEVEYGFIMNNREAVYRFSFTNQIIYESLYCFTGKQRGYLFKFTSDPTGEISTKIHSELIQTASFKKEILELVNQYWGKHTFLSIMTKQSKEKNRKFINDNVSPYFSEAIKQLGNLFISSKFPYGNERHVRFSETENILETLDSGIVPISQIEVIKRTEKILRDFFTQAYADVKDVQYDLTNIEEDKYKYQLFFIKMICGKPRKISFANESSGTQQVLRIIRSLIGLFFGVTVVYDEIDDGVHDILLSQIIKSLQGEISGQLIITTHNTMLLEELDPHYVYFISTDYLGNRSVRCAADYVIQANHNLRSRYLKGLYGGIPYVEGIDFDAIEQFLAEGGDTSWQEESK